MTTPQHGVQGVAVSYLIFNDPWFIFIAFILSIIPDIGRFFQKDSDNRNGFYTWAYTSWYCYLILFWNIYILQDL